MKKNVKYLLILLAVLVVLGGAVAAVTLLPSGEDEPASSGPVSAAPELDSLFSQTEEHAASIEVKNSEGEYTLIANPQVSDRMFLLEGYEEFELNTLSIEATGRGLFYAATARELGEQSNLESFGLEGENATQVTINYKDGTKEELVLGIRSSEIVGWYALKDGQVYILTGVPDRLFVSPLGFINISGLVSIADRVADPEENISEIYVEDNMYSFRLSGTNFPKPINIVLDNNMLSGYRITEPVNAESGNTAFQEMRDSLKSITAYDVAEAGITEENLVKYGLDEPFAQVEYNINGSMHTVAVSAADGEFRYMMVDDKNVIFRIYRSTVQPWAETDLQTLRMSYVMVAMIDNVKTLTVNHDGKKYVYNITRTVNEKLTTNDSVTYYDLAVQTDAGKDIEYTSYQNFYGWMMGLAIFSNDEIPYDPKDVIFSVRRDYFDGSPADVVEICRADSADRYVAVFNGSFNGVLRASEVDAMLVNVPKLYAGETVERKK